MNKSFDEMWKKLQTNLKPGLTLGNWTYLKGYLGDTMRVEEVDKVEIVVHSPKAKNLQHVSKADFEIIWEVRDEYKNGRYHRQDMRDLTMYSKYIISILHWLETHTQ